MNRVHWHSAQGDVVFSPRRTSLPISVAQRWSTRDAHKLRMSSTTDCGDTSSVGSARTGEKVGNQRRRRVYE